jgi:hypothetical protein
MADIGVGWKRTTPVVAVAKGRKEPNLEDRESLYSS